MTDLGTFDGPMPTQAETLRVTLPCVQNDHAVCMADWCQCPCHAREIAA